MNLNYRRNLMGYSILMANNDSWRKDKMYNKERGAKHPPLYPNEYMVKCFSSDSYSFINKKLRAKADASPNPLRVLEVGFFSGNNIRFFLDKGYEVEGCEISEEIGGVGVKNLRDLGYGDFKAKVGENIELPYNDETFDVLVSINTLHYSASEHFRNAIREWRRVLKVGGILYVETVGPDHFVRIASTRKAELLWVWEYDDFRKGQEFGFLDSEAHLKEELQKAFKIVETGNRKEKFPKQTLDFLIGIAEK